jgi:hypothetical protein
MDIPKKIGLLCYRRGVFALGGLNRTKRRGHQFCWF